MSSGKNVSVAALNVNSPKTGDNPKSYRRKKSNMKNLDKLQVRTDIDQEGFDYCFTKYSEYQEIKDPKFHELRQTYLEAREELASYVGWDH